MGCKAREEVMANHSWIARMQNMIGRVEQILEGEGAVMGKQYHTFLGVWVNALAISELNALIADAITGSQH